MSAVELRGKSFRIRLGKAQFTRSHRKDTVVEGSRKLNADFNTIFDRLWSNEGELNYTFDYEAYDLKNTRKLVLGYEVFQELDEALRQALSEQVKERFIQNSSHLLIGMSSKEKLAWAQEKLDKDKSARIREMSLVLGEREVQKSEENQKEWNEDYINKWVKGEKWGYVAW